MHPGHGFLTQPYSLIIGYVEFSSDEFSMALETRAASLPRVLFGNVVRQRIKLSTCGPSAINVANISSELMSFSDIVEKTKKCSDCGLSRNVL